MKGYQYLNLNGIVVSNEWVPVSNGIVVSIGYAPVSNGIVVSNKWGTSI